MIKILYIDCETDQREVTHQFQGMSSDIQVETTLSAQEAWNMLEGSRYDAIISDHQIPRLDGISFLKQLRVEGNDIPFILFTSHGREEIIVEALNNGADSFLQKGGDPCAQIKELERKVRETIRCSTAEHTLQEYEERLRRAQVIGMTGCWEFHLGPESGHIWASKEAFCLFGIPWKSSGLLSLEEVEACIPEQGRVHQALLDLIEKGKTYNIEYEIVPADGGRRSFIRSVAELVSEWNGRPIKVLGIIQDITERKRAEENLKASEEMYRDLILNAPTAIYELDYRGPTFKSVNEAMCHISGYSREELLSSNPLDLLDQESRGRFQERIRKGLARETIDEKVEYKGITKGGSDIWFTISIKNMYKGGKLDGVFVVAHDITERKRMEDELRRTNEKLDLLNSITRHDINNQLMVLRGNVELIKRQVSDPGVLSRFDRIERSIANIGEQIEFTKAYQKAGTTAPEWQRIREFLLDPLQYIELESLDISDIGLHLEIYADQMLSKVFYNLIENSIKYGGKNVSARIHCQEIQDGLLLIYEDDGIGIPAGEKEKIFVKGFGKGTGFGMFLSRRILAITGITIHETGVPGKGARFEMSVPRGKFRIASSNNSNG